jgi:hypothetical protein
VASGLQNKASTASFNNTVVCVKDVSTVRLQKEKSLKTSGMSPCIALASSAS